MTKKEALQAIEEMRVSTFNVEQKTLSKDIIKAIPNDQIDLITKAYQLLTSRIKLGFSFDEAIGINKKSLTLLDDKKHLDKWINASKKDILTNSLIIGENFDALNWLNFIADETNTRGIDSRDRDRQRERERELFATNSWYI